MYFPRFGYDTGYHRALLQFFSPKTRSPIEDKSEKTCDECNGSTFGVALPHVEIISLGNTGTHTFMHKNCIEKTHKIINDVDLRKRQIREVRLSKLWKYQGRPDRLQTRDPLIYMITMLDEKKNAVDFIVCTFNSTEKVEPAKFPGLEEHIPISADGKPWYTYLMGLTTFAQVHVAPIGGTQSIPIKTMIPQLTERIREYGMRDAFPHENRVIKWVRKTTGHSYSGSREPPYNPCPKCGRIHLADKA
jgi:hypothetical protein